MKLRYYQVDAFANEIFSGNPAIVVEVKSWLDDQTLQNIARENSVDATAFFVVGESEIQLRWFTPDLELDLCGHATLAAAHVLKKELNYAKDSITFQTSAGLLYVEVEKDLYTLDMPSRKPVKTVLPEFIAQSLSKQPIEVLKARDYILVYGSENDVRDIQIDQVSFNKGNIDPGGVAITAKGDRSDFVSRFFVPQATIFEDPVTGSAHASLVPYWSEKLGKQELFAVQLSERQGKLHCKDHKGRVLVSGHAITYSAGVLNISLK
ncbi:MAG: PhzF family phenazine biosynthesis protein [Reichenbachiella sp.]|uniref:PhzF family phenazine biosynthesis protein n=1 Tax=Reichenbachiella sp. TaxID=2184521 RepID=UPI0032634084